MRGSRLLLLLLAGASAAVLAGEGVPAPGAPVALGKLEPFWRYSAGLGPFHEGGQGLVVVPDVLLQGDFAYRKRPYPKEALFADHLSLVRLLGGFNDGSAQGAPDLKVRERDLAYRCEDGKIRYRMQLLRPRLQPYLDNGYTRLTLVLDNVPWCFPAKPGTGGLGQYSPPRDPKEWYDFIQALCRELVAIMGRGKAEQLRFRVGTENNGRQRFNGTQEEYLRHYDTTAAAVRSVLPGAEVGPFNISGVSVRGIAELHNVNAFALAEHCFREPNLATGQGHTPFGWVAFSRYFRPSDDPEEHARVCRQVWEEFGRRVPEMKGVSREIHEFGIAPWGEVAKGTFASAEPGALGAALTCQLMLRLREAGINRLWHWGVLDNFRDRANQLRSFPTGQAWLLSVLDRMAGGDAYLFPTLEPSPAGAKHLAAGSFKGGGAILLVSAYHTDIARHDEETIRFRVPAGLLPRAGSVRFVRLTRETAVHDRIRRDLAAAGLLKEEFAARPDRLGTVREMGTGRDAERLVGDRLPDYERQWVASMTLGPLTAEAGTVTSDAAGHTFTLRLAPPEVLALVIDAE